MSDIASGLRSPEPGGYHGGDARAGPQEVLDQATWRVQRNESGKLVRRSTGVDKEGIVLMACVKTGGTTQIVVSFWVPHKGQLYVYSNRNCVYCRGRIHKPDIGRNLSFFTLRQGTHPEMEPYSARFNVKGHESSDKGR